MKIFHKWRYDESLPQLKSTVGAHLPISNRQSQTPVYSVSAVIRSLLQHLQEALFAARVAVRQPWSGI
jgi:hypothetical protein